MNKIVINDCYGGFGLSKTAEEWLKEHYNVTEPDTLSRHDKRLVECVETLGENASDDCARLVIRTIQGDMYRICDYDGMETIEVPEYVDWINIK